MKSVSTNVSFATCPRILKDSTDTLAPVFPVNPAKVTTPYLLSKLFHMTLTLVHLGGLKGWGKEGEQVPCESAIDKNDPNYEDPEDPSLA